MIHPPYLEEPVQRPREYYHNFIVRTQLYQLKKIFTQDAACIPVDESHLEIQQFYKKWNSGDRLILCIAYDIYLQSFDGPDILSDPNFLKLISKIQEIMDGQHPDFLEHRKTSRLHTSRVGLHSILTTLCDMASTSNRE